MEFVNQIDKGETNLLNIIGENFVKNKDYANAIVIYKKIGNFKNLALAYMKNEQWDQVE